MTHREIFTASGDTMNRTRSATHTARRWYSMDSYEQMIYNKLREHFRPLDLSVKDVSGGCGSMFAISIQSAAFDAIPMVKQHRLVNDLLKDEISKWHGLQLKTKKST